MATMKASRNLLTMILGASMIACHVASAKTEIQSFPSGDQQTIIHKKTELGDGAQRPHDETKARRVLGKQREEDKPFVHTVIYTKKTTGEREVVRPDPHQHIRGGISTRIVGGNVADVGEYPFFGT